MYGGFYLEMKFSDVTKSNLLRGSLNQHLFQSSLCKHQCGFVNKVKYCKNEGWNVDQKTQCVEQYRDRKDIYSAIHLSPSCDVRIEQPLHADNWIDLVLNQENASFSENNLLQMFSVSPSVSQFIPDQRYELNLYSHSPLHLFLLLVSANSSVAHFIQNVSFSAKITGRANM